MAYVVAEPCIRCRYTDCVEVCPVDCFHGGANFLVIDPDECIDCGACEPVCPVNAIFVDDDLPDRWREFVALNAELSRRWPVVAAKLDPLPDADEWKGREPKRAELDVG
ncbi:MAG TPA: ferredoxin family protein [Anaeromyxobacteraceae bacterium]|nr:ferredoxin family protein [Anaeromyxobacteraceae bacterium]